MPKKQHQLLILGNGFDLKCGLASKYGDFFDWRLRKLFKITDTEKIRQRLGLDFSLEKLRTSNEKFVVDFRELSKQYQDITIWDIIFLISDEYLELNAWHDVEKMIYNVVSLLCNCQVNWKYKKDMAHEDIETFQGKIVNLIIGKGENFNQIQAIKLLNELKQFERVFAEYIYSQLDSEKDNNFDSDYYRNSRDLLEQLINYGHIENSLTVDAISFNYTLDPRFRDKINSNWSRTNIKINAWNNIHGLATYKDVNAQQVIAHSTEKLLPQPIFGIDSHDIKQDVSDDDPRLIFTKAYRIVSANMGNLRENYNLKDIDKITIYGHSLNSADYTYFAIIFDECNIYDGNTVLEFYYYVDEIPNEDRELLETKACDEFSRRLVKLLNDYGRTLDKSHAENLATKLVMEGRLQLIPYYNN